jgi:hypothetical protein
MAEQAVTTPVLNTFIACSRTLSSTSRLLRAVSSGIANNSSWLQGTPIRNRRYRVIITSVDTQRHDNTRCRFESHLVQASDVTDVTQPVVNQTKFFLLKRSLHSATVVMTRHCNGTTISTGDVTPTVHRASQEMVTTTPRTDDVFDLEYLHCTQRHNRKPQ